MLLGNWSARSEENARRAREYFFGMQNCRKALDGRLAGLLDPELMGQNSRRKPISKRNSPAKPEFADALAAYDKIAAATKITRRASDALCAARSAAMAFNCEQFSASRARCSARARSGPSPTAIGCANFPMRAKHLWNSSLFSTKPIYTDLEILTLSDSLTFLATQFGDDDPLVQKVLAGKSPHERAVDLINDHESARRGFSQKTLRGRRERGVRRE